MLLQTLKKLLKHSVIYGLGGMLAKLLGFVLLPIYTRYLTPADYGILVLLGVTSSFAAAIAQLGLGSALFREVIYKESDESTVVSTAFYFLLVESILFFGGLIAFSPQLSHLIFDTLEYTHLLHIVFLTGVLSMFNVIVMAILRTREQSALYSILSVAKFLVGAILNIYFIVVLQRGVEGLLIAGLISTALFAVVDLALLSRDIRLTFSVPILRRMLGFGVPLVPAGLSSLVMTSADRFFLQVFSTPAEVGLYSLGYNIGMVVNLIVGAIQLAWPAQLFVIAKQPDAERQFAQILTYYLFAIGFIGLGLSVLAREVLVIMTTPRFYGAYVVIPLIVLSYIFYGIRFMTNIALPIQDKMKYMPPIIIGSAILNLGLSYILIPRYGMMGAAWATAISYLILVVVQTAVNLRFWYIPYEYKRIAKISLVWGGVYGSSLLIRTPSVWLSSGLKVALLTTYPFLLYALHFYEKQELATFKRLFRLEISRVSAYRKRL